MARLEVTVDDVRKAVGLLPRDEALVMLRAKQMEMRERLKREGHLFRDEERQTGRSTETMLEAAASAANGHTVVIIAFDITYAMRMAQTIQRWAGRFIKQPHVIASAGGRRRTQGEVVFVDHCTPERG